MRPTERATAGFLTRFERCPGSDDVRYNGAGFVPRGGTKLRPAADGLSRGEQTRLPIGSSLCRTDHRRPFFGEAIDVRGLRARRKSVDGGSNRSTPGSGGPDFGPGKAG